MEKNRNIEFNSKVEFNSLKDAVWRLTTRVYLLEDFIAQRFGEELGPDGYTKLTPSAPGPSLVQTSTNPSESSVIENSSIHNRKLRKRGPVSCPESEKESRKVSRTLKTGVCYTDSVSTSKLTATETLGPSEADEILIYKDELQINSDLESDGDEDFFNSPTEKDNDVNDSVEKTSDSIPTGGGDCTFQNSFSVSDSDKKEKFEEQVKLVSQTKIHTKCLSAQKYSSVLERLKLLTTGTKKTFNDLNILRSYKLANEGNGYFIVNKDDKRLVSLDNIYGILEAAHKTTGHGGRDSMKRHISKTFGNITTQHITIFLQLCEECRLKRESGGRPRKSVEISTMSTNQT